MAACYSSFADAAELRPGADLSAALSFSRQRLSSLGKLVDQAVSKMNLLLNRLCQSRFDRDP